MTSPLSRNGAVATSLPPQVRTTTDLGAERIERETPFGTLIFENADVGQWRTKAGTPAKRAKRTYSLEGEELAELVSVTTVLDVLAKPALINWAEDHGARGAIEAQRMGELPDDLPLDEVIQRVRAL